MGASACSSEPANQSELSEHEVMALIQKDTEIILQHLNSLARTSHGKEYLADLFEEDLKMDFELKWYEQGKEVGKAIGTNDEVYKGVTQEHVEKALFHVVTMSIKVSSTSSTFPTLGQWRIYPDNRIIPSPNALRLEAELVR